MKRILFIATIMLAVAFGAKAQTATGAQDDTDAKYATEMLKEGTTAPAFTLADPEGKKHSLKDFKGQYVVLDFWASWCPDCRKDVPEVKELYKKYGSKVKFIGISFDDKRENWTKYIGANDMPWLHLSELKRMRQSAVAKSYKISWIPAVYIVNPQGRIVLKTVMIEKVAAKLKEISERIK